MFNSSSSHRGRLHKAASQILAHVLKQLELGNDACIAKTLLAECSQGIGSDFKLSWSMSINKNDPNSWELFPSL